METPAPYTPISPHLVDATFARFLLNLDLLKLLTGKAFSYKIQNRTF
ncbi:MAG: hypothetical protein SAK29_27850 [Scytonema sp. PMC 1069.18]|nr:hypothetical protein [Scytonema sp. PMC 1069.18]MEC4888284.1 hypothetical protein [Scytonema sp. PMC 1070.18]